MAPRIFRDVTAPRKISGQPDCGVIILKWENYRVCRNQKTNCFERHQNTF